MNSVLPGAAIGILGGGQLGRMSALAAAAMGYRVHIFCPEQHSPAAQVSHAHMCAAYEDEAALERFAAQVDVVSFEFENIPFHTVEFLERYVPVRPGSKALRVCQHRLREKECAQALGIGTAPFAAVKDAVALEAAVKAIGTPAILKTCEMGYDGKGQWRITRPADVQALSLDYGIGSYILEGFVPFKAELSVLVARTPEGKTAFYGPVENTHRNHILYRTVAPALVSETVTAEAQRIALRLAETLDLVGLLAVELFLLEDGTLLMNEMAPRPHNSGHYSMDACIAGQFEQYIRAICGLPLGDSRQWCEAEMVNLVGEEALDVTSWLANPHAKLHLYGKSEARSGRKMGHVTLLKP